MSGIEITIFTESFNTQPPEGGWFRKLLYTTAKDVVSTHSRLKAAGSTPQQTRFKLNVSTHSRLKAAGGSVGIVKSGIPCFNTQPPEGGWVAFTIIPKITHTFQHTAA